MGWDALEINVVFAESFFELVGAFVVKDVETGSVAVGLEPCVQCGPGGGEFAGLASFDGLGENGIAVKIVEDHHGGIAARGLDWESSCLVRVGFVERSGWENGGEDDVCGGVV
jgi:hypothetical protein